MGILLCALLWGVIVLEEIECTPKDLWQQHGIKKVLLLRNTRKKFTYLLAFFVGAFFLAFEIYFIATGRSTFNPLQALGMFGILFGCYIFAVNKKGR